MREFGFRFRFQFSGSVSGSVSVSGPVLIYLRAKSSNLNVFSVSPLSVKGERGKEKTGKCH